MSDGGQPWSVSFAPRSLKDLVDNARAVDRLLSWLRSWERGMPEKRAAFLYGPPGVGKTSAAVAAARDLGLDLLEVNASDYRTGRRLDALIGRAAAQGLTVTGRRRMVLLDELEGVSGREDEGGIAAIVRIIASTRSPVVLVATTGGEGWEERFAPLREASLLLEFGPIPFSDVLRRLREVAGEAGVSVDEEVLELIAERSRGDLRSAINDLEAASRGRERVSSGDVAWLGERDRQAFTSEALMRIFSARSLSEARRALSSAYIGYDDLFDWLGENLPLLLDDPRDLAEGLDALAAADIHEARARRTQEYRLLKYMFNEMTGGVALSRRRSEGAGLLRQARSVLRRLGLPPSTFTIDETPRGLAVRPLRRLGDEWSRVNSVLRGLGGAWARGEGFWLLPRLRPPQLVWWYRRSWHGRRMRDGVAAGVAARCHISTREAVREVIPLLRVIFRSHEGMAGEIARWLELDGGEVEWLSS